ncbi:MAG: hypothetical protein K5679_00220 [Lachnospiraceae bacterium]|nr:hypothetical protein [Lachnospiraceae bacterium]
MNSNRKLMKPNDNKGNNHHTLFIALIIALFVLLVVALSKTHTYGAELGFDESEVSGNEEIYEEITESSEEDFEEGTSVSFNEAVKEDIQDSEIILRGSTLSSDVINETPLDNTPLLGAEGDNNDSEYLTLSRKRNCHIDGNDSDGYFIRYRDSYNYYIDYTLLTAGTNYLIDASGPIYLGNSINNDSQVYLLTETSYIPSSDIYVIQYHISSYYMNISIDTSGSGSGDTPDPPEPSGNDPSGNDPSGGGIELNGDLQTYLVNYFGHKDYTVYDSEETFKEKKFFVSRYEYEVLKSLDDIKILLLCNVGVLIVILFVGRRKRNAGS